jgi:hypothetical protein
LMGNLAGSAALLQPATERVSAVTNMGTPAKRIQRQLEILFTFHPPLFLSQNPTTENRSKRFIFRQLKKGLFPPPLCPLIFNLLTSSFNRSPNPILLPHPDK